MLNTDNAAQFFMYPLGLEAKDIITGYKGIILYRVQHITGCDGYGLQAPTPTDKTEIPASHQCDESRIEIIGKGLLSQEQYDEFINDSTEVLEETKVEEIPKPGGPQVSAAKKY